MTEEELSVSHSLPLKILYQLSWPRVSQGLAHWKKFYAEHKAYVRVGRVIHPQIDPASPIPEHCDPKKAKAAKEEEAAKERKKSERDEL